MPAIKLGLSFFTYKDGKMINHTSGATTVNNLSEGIPKAQEFVKKHFPEVNELQIKKDDDFLDQGGRVLRANSKIDETMTFVIVISRQ